MLKKITEDLEYLKSSLDQIREKPLKMATDFFKGAILKINEEHNLDALTLLHKTVDNASEGIHMATTFSCMLKCVQLKMMSATLIESAIDVDGLLCFIPLECLPQRKRDCIKELLKDGLEAIINRAGKRSFFGKFNISIKKQNEIGNLTIIFMLT